MELPTTSKAITVVFDERKKFIVVGLTGRTGSGCSTTASLMIKDWPHLKSPKPQAGTFHKNEDRKYRILFDFAKSNWKPFRWIQIKDVITSYILLEPYNSFKEFVIDQISQDSASQNILFDKDEAIKKLNAKVEEEYNRLFEQLKELPHLNHESNELIKRYEECIDFYLSRVPEFSKLLKGVLQSISRDSYTKIYQIVGDNIRSSGNAISEKFDAVNFYTIATSTNKLIKLLRHDAKQKGKDTLVVIDAIRNPFEATYFRERYSAFYLIAVNCPNEDRVKRLQKAYDYSPSQVRAIDKKEYEERPYGHNIFVSQDIRRCIEISDIYFRNVTLGEADFSFLKQQLVWYVTLMMHPGLVTPTSYEHAMQLAYSAKLSSGCIARQVGAVVTDQNLSIKAVGWNNTPQKQVPCLLRSATSLLKYDDKDAFSKFEMNDVLFREKLDSVMGSENITQKKIDALKGRNLSFCFKDIRNAVKNGDNQVLTRSLHAEENSFLQISKYGGQGLEDGILFTTASPCELCAKKSYQLGISEIYYIDPYPGIAIEHVLKGGGKNPKLILFSGAIGRAYHQLFQPILPYKDELQMLLGYTWNAKTESLEDEYARLRIRVSELEKRLSSQVQKEVPTKLS